MNSKPATRLQAFPGCAHSSIVGQTDRPVTNSWCEVDFLFDENTDPTIGAALRRDRPNITIWQVGGTGAPAYGTADHEILIWCEAHHCALVTKNRSTMPVHLNAHIAAGRNVLGIFVISHESSMGVITADVALIWDAAQPGEFDNQIVYLPL